MLNNKALAASVSAPPAVYVEDVFSTWLYTGTGSTQTITNGIDLSGKGGMVWCKGRDAAIWNHITDTARGAAYTLYTNSTDASVGPNSNISSFNSNGFTLGPSGSSINQNGNTYASWTFRKQAKFFDVVTYTGTGVARTISHNLGSVPGCIIVKSTSQSDNWKVYHRSLTSNAYYILLDSTAAQSNAVDLWNSTTPTSTEFSIGSSGNINTNGATYVAYLFAHNAGGFGTAGTDSVISCGSYTGNGSTSGPTVTLGWEPQWLLVKNASASGDDWILVDNMRGFPVTGNTAYLNPNNAFSESNFPLVSPTATGFQPRTTDSGYNGSGATYIYIAIRRGPMKTPTSATSVFNADAYSGTNTAMTRTTGFVVDQVFSRGRGSGNEFNGWDRMRGGTKYLLTASTAAEGTFDFLGLDSNVGYTWKTSDGFATSTGNYINYSFRRAPGFFDVVAYTGTGSATTVSHNLGVVPELMLVKCRSVGTFWRWYWAPLGATKNFYMPNDEASVTQTEIWNNTSPTSTVFTVGTSTDTNFSARTYIAYLFASLTGISKVGSYTGTGTTLNIDCGFTAGARFVLIKRSDSTGDWYVYDTARGIVSGNDPYLLLNSNAAEVTGTDYIDPLSSGFQISSTAPAAINANGGTFVYLAIA